MKDAVAFLLLIICCSCSQTETKDQKTRELEKKEFKQNTVKRDSVKNDTVEFISYNDNFDYSQLNGKKGKEEIDFINDNNNDRSLLRGDLIAITWKYDSIFIAGDGETPQNAQWIVSAKKIKDGSVSKFRSEYGKEIKYHFSKEDQLSDSYLDHLYQLAEYYIANSNKNIIKSIIKKKDDLAYSVEKREREEKQYYVLGIYTEFEHHINTVQWLYIDPEDDKIYEYDLADDRLIYFP
ncbi:hypothetical protein OMO38_18720 [Chryseobacterium sp. 09-1422]|uniref:Lipoprotein n=1 Tax=Chryseobacterium kimseyorum TaxID=2984028 RepID=A0ABT3I3C1_9FLAO|nr:hypothetical protein [Chryseobacterium kimseyorum]MCW3170566.1 hypothetical protein [Chryseobacterium kimseyorum]